MPNNNTKIHNIENTITAIASSLKIDVNKFIENGNFDTDGFLIHAERMMKQKSKTA